MLFPSCLPIKSKHVLLLHCSNLIFDKSWEIEPKDSFKMFYYLFIFCYSGSSLLGGHFSRGGEQRLLSSCGARAFIAMASLAVNLTFQGRVREVYDGRGSQTPEHRRSGCRCMALAALWLVGSSQTKDRISVSYIGRQILYHWAIREAPRGI